MRQREKGMGWWEMRDEPKPRDLFEWLGFDDEVRETHVRHGNI